MEILLALLLGVAILATLPPLIPAATVSGKAYDLSLGPVNGSILTVNTTPKQAIVLQDGSYSLNLSQGNYLLEVSYYQGGVLTMHDAQNVSIVDNGSYTIDFVLLPNISLNTSIPGQGFDVTEIATDDNDSGTYLLGGGIVALAAVLLYFFLGRRKKTETKPNTLPNDLDSVVSLLRESGGRMNQKDITTRLNYSEAKVSLMVSDLEQREIVKRFKKGRGNIVRLEE